MDKTTKTVLNIASGDLPDGHRPFDQWAREAKMETEEFLAILSRERAGGAVRRFGAVLRHTESGFVKNAMVAWVVETERADGVASVMIKSSAVSHCYLREPAPDWPYTLYTMIHATSDEELDHTIGDLSRRTGILEYTVLETIRELKKTSPRYLSP
jgi:DNA-binding Lrp family transcriptional regulator